MKILISGGHLTPALAFIDYVQKTDESYSFLFAGRIYTREKSKQKAKEKSAAKKRNIPFIPFDSGKLGQDSLLLLPVSLLKTIGAYFTALKLFSHHKPAAYLSFGTYLSVPLALAAWVMRVPIIVHEQTRSIGIANALVSRIATMVAVTYPETVKMVKNKQVYLTGNPIRESILQKSEKIPDWYKTKAKDPILFVVGGSQGSEVINTTISRCISTLTKKYVVIHQCGTKTKLRNYKKELEFTKKQLSLAGQNKYFIHEWIGAEDLAWIYTHAYLAISRAGANTVQELSLRHIPTIYIPLPFSHKNEQLLNAKALSDTGQAVMIQQKDLSPDVLIAVVGEIDKKHNRIQRTLQTEQASLSAGSQELFARIHTLLQP